MQRSWPTSGGLSGDRGGSGHPDLLPHAEETAALSADLDDESERTPQDRSGDPAGSRHAGGALLLLHADWQRASEGPAVELCERCAAGRLNEHGRCERCGYAECCGSGTAATCEPVR